MLKRVHPYLILALLSGLTLGGYLLASHFTYRLGFPLDDAWIHQSYARNLALHGEWSFLPGQPSAGSTSPLWSALLALGYVLRLDPRLWSYLLGWSLLSAVAVAGAAAFRALCPTRPGWAVWVGAMLVFEWHLVWSAGSGMETLLFALLVLLVLTWLVSGRGSWLGLGLLTGLSVWVRPDGITLAGPAIFVALTTAAVPGASLWRRKGVAVGLFTLGVAILFVPYLLFNRALAGAWWPNTFFAKQAEYAVLVQLPLWKRFLMEAGLPMVGIGAILLPGLAFFWYDTIWRRSWRPLAGLLWVAGYLFLYAWRLPVTYQHGRYIIPAMPVFFLWGAAGMAAWIIPESPFFLRRVLGKTWQFSAVLVLLLFSGLGARAYAQDVAIIESEMVATALWVAVNAEPDALVAAHDIGALGYFGGRQILDLAGLVSPEVIPIIRNETGLKAFLDEQSVDYLVTFPDWYPLLVRRAVLIYSSQGIFSPAAGGENMAVYRWRIP